ncbi:hypothetical protein evm_006140 [Chilo suppressalis]|nr:hypothetical protein evm_006140 [Chilo suppressalis]
MFSKSGWIYLTVVLVTVNGLTIHSDLDDNYDKSVESYNGTAVQERTGKILFPFVSIVRFANTECASTNTMNGTCLARRECNDLQGTITGICASRRGRCCVISRSCGSTTNVNNTYFSSPGYPAAFGGGATCSIIVNRCNNNVCQILEKNICEEFPASINALENFFSRRQGLSEEPLTFFYILDELATKAGAVIDDKCFIRQFEKMANLNTKNFRAFQLYSDKTHLKNILRQAQDIFGDESAEICWNLPIQPSFVTPMTNFEAAKISPIIRHEEEQEKEINFISSQSVLSHPIVPPEHMIPRTFCSSNTNKKKYKSKKKKHPKKIFYEENVMTMADGQDFHSQPSENNNQYTSESKPLINITCRDKKFVGLIDSGAAVSVVSKDTVNRIHQRIDESDMKLKAVDAPNGCLQYYRGTTGTIRSFNYGGAANVALSASLVTGTRQIVNMNYGICIRMEAGFCAIDYTQSAGLFTFTVSGDVEGADNTVLGTAVGAANDGACTTDFVVIPNPTNSATGVAVGTDRFCGLGFVPVRSAAKPFVLYVVTNGNEGATPTSPPDVANRGFSLTYAQVAC